MDGDFGSLQDRDEDAEGGLNLVVRKVGRAAVGQVGDIEVAVVGVGVGGGAAIDESTGDSTSGRGG